MLLLAGVFFSMLDATAKYLVRDHSLLLVVWARYAGQMLVATPIAAHRGGLGFWRTRHLGLQLVRSAALVLSTGCFFAGLRFLPLAEGTAIMFLTPMIAIVLSVPVLRERPSRARWMASFAGFLGVLLLVRPGSAVFHPATGLLVLAAVFNAFYQLLTRKLPHDTPYTTLFYTALVGTVLLSLALPFVATRDDVTLRGVGFIVVLGLLAGLGHWMLIGAFLKAPASLLAPFTYAHMLWATAWGYLVFGQLPDGVSSIGMAIIVASGVALFAHERRVATAFAASGRGR